MPISYSYNSNEGYVEVLVIGLTSDKEIMEARINYLSDSSWIPGVPEFIDLSEANFENVSPSGLQKISSFSNHVFKSTEVTTVKIAVYAPDIVPSIMLSLYGDMSKETVENVKVFSEKAEAIKWLLEGSIRFEYSIDLDKGIVYCKFIGTSIAERLIKQILTIRKDPKFRVGLNTIADLRETIYPDATRNMIKMSEFTHATFAERGNFRLALIVNSSNMNLVELYKDLTRKGQVKLCSNMSEAESWMSHVNK
jgi:hypothetical protein